MRTELKIALLQISPTGTLHGNLRKGMDACRSAAESGADIALFPEMWSNGYNIYERHFEQWKNDAILPNSSFVQAFSELALELNMAIGITFLEQFSPAPRNSLILFDRHGQLCIHYSKVHTCDFGPEHELTPGNDFPVAALDTDCGPVNIGAMICYDREFPESARILMLKGAELILVPNACPMEINRLSQLRARAYENMTAIATCNYPDSVPDCNGGSSVFDGVAYLPQLSGSRDTCLLQADSTQGIYFANLDLEQLREYRNCEVHGNAYRRPEMYDILLKRDVQPPFIRTDRRTISNDGNA